MNQMRYAECHCHQCAGGLSLLGFEVLKDSENFQCCDDHNQLHGYNQTEIAAALSLSNTTLPSRKYHSQEEPR